MLSVVAISASFAHGQIVSEFQSQPASAGPSWQEFTQTVQRLENEIRSLREGQIEHPPHVVPLIPHALPTVAESIQPLNVSQGLKKQAYQQRSGAGSDSGITLAGFSTRKAGGWRIVPFGMLRGELIYSQQEQAADAIIFFLTPDSIGVDDDQFTAHGKTSMLNFALTGPDMGSWQTGGAIVMNFTGSQPLRNTSGPQVLNAYGEIKNDDWRFAFGRMFDLFSPIVPNTVNMGQQRAAGNVGIYRGAMQIDRYIKVSEEAKWTLSGRVSQPVVKDFLLLPTARGTDNGIPNFEGRIGLELGPERDGHRTMEIGVSGLWGETRAFDPARFVFEGGDEPVVLPPASNVSTTAGGNIDFQLHGERVGFRCEF
jgi:hypothetical protein